MARDEFRQALIRATGEDCVLSAEAARFCYAYDAAGQPPVLPELVVCPDRAEQIGPVLALCQAHDRPVTLLEDATVPRSRVPDMVEAVNRVARTHNVRIATFGHAGDGNLHPTFLYDRRDGAESARVAAAVDDIFHAALELGGTLSGEHGIGTAKAAWLENEPDRGHLLYSRRLRKGVDPKGLLNPDKLVGVRG